MRRVPMVCALILLAAACGSDDGEEAANTTTTSTTVAEAADDDAALPVAYCEAWAKDQRNADGVLALMTGDARAVDMTAGVEYAGSEEIRTRIEGDSESHVLDEMACGEEGVTARGWAAYGYSMSSSTEPGGTEGVGVVHLDQDGYVDQFLAYHTGVAGEPSAPNVLTEENVAVVDEYRRSYEERDVDAFVASVSDDFVRYRSPPGLPAPAFPGLEGYRTWAAETEGDNVTVDMGEVAIGSGPWIAHADVWFDADGDSSGGSDVQHERFEGPEPGVVGPPPAGGLEDGGIHPTPDHRGGPDRVLSFGVLRLRGGPVLGQEAVPDPVAVYRFLPC